jgi:hypothetical protein
MKVAYVRHLLVGSSVKTEECGMWLVSEYYISFNLFIL